MTNKYAGVTFSFLILAMLWSCDGPTIHYLGKSYPETKEIKEYFDEKDITSKYRVIGTMTNDKFVNYDVDYIREYMIKKAQQVGADAILYFPVEVDYDHKEGDRTAVKAKLLKFE